MNKMIATVPDALNHAELEADLQYSINRNALNKVKDNCNEYSHANDHTKLSRGTGTLLKQILYHDERSLRFWAQFQNVNIDSHRNKHRGYCDQQFGTTDHKYRLRTRSVLVSKLCIGILRLQST